MSEHTYAISLHYRSATVSGHGFESPWTGIQKLLKQNVYWGSEPTWGDLPLGEIAVILRAETPPSSDNVVEASLASAFIEKWKPVAQAVTLPFQVKSTHFKQLERYQPKMVERMREWNRILISTLENVEGSVLVIGIIQDGKRLYLRSASCWGDEPVEDPMQATNYAVFADDELQQMWDDMSGAYITDQGGAKSGFRTDVAPVAYVFGPEVEEDGSTKIMPCCIAPMPKPTQ